MSYPNNYTPNPFMAFGKTAKKYGLIRMILAIILMIAMQGLASMTVVDIQNIDPSDQQALEEAFATLIAGAILYIFLLAIGYIVLIVFLIQYLSKLKKLEQYTGNSNLKTVFWLEITNLILVVLGGLILGIFAAPIKIGLFVIIVFILEKWVQSFPARADNPSLGERTKTSFLIMKIGAIVELIINIIVLIVTIPGIFRIILLYIGILLWGYGFWKLGGEILASDSIQASPSSNKTEPTFNQGPPINTPHYNTPTHFGTPASNQSNLGNFDKCKFCGATLIDKDSSFCSTCGQKVN